MSSDNRSESDIRNDWTPSLVHRHISSVISSNDRRYEERFESQEKAINAALIATEKALAVAEHNAEKWRINVNEWRAEMDNREDKFTLQVETDVQFRAYNERVSKLEIAEANRMGKGAGLSTGWTLLAGAIGLFLTILTLINMFVNFKVSP